MHITIVKIKNHKKITNLSFKFFLKYYFLENIVRIYVNHVRNICHLVLTNLLTKHTLLVIR